MMMYVYIYVYQELITQEKRNWRILPQPFHPPKSKSIVSKIVFLGNLLQQLFFIIFHIEHNEWKSDSIVRV